MKIFHILVVARVKRGSLHLSLPVIEQTEIRINPYPLFCVVYVLF
jgi:hypothetical protein